MERLCSGGLAAATAQASGAGLECRFLTSGPISNCGREQTIIQHLLPIRDFRTQKQAQPHWILLARHSHSQDAMTTGTGNSPLATSRADTCALKILIAYEDVLAAQRAM